MRDVMGRGSSNVLSIVVAGDVMERCNVHTTFADTSRRLLHGDRIVSILYANRQVAEDVIFFTPCLIAHPFDLGLRLTLAWFAARLACAGLRAFQALEVVLEMLLLKINGLGSAARM